MKLDGLTPSQGPKPVDRLAGKAKAEPKAGGKSFADALGKAQAGASPAAGAAPAPASQPAAVPAEPQSDQVAPPPMDSHMDTVRFRLQSGYYNNPKVDDELSDKLSGFFDEIA